MYLQAVDYVAFRIETSQFHDFESKKKFPPRSLPFTALDQPHIPVDSLPLPLLYLWTNPEAYYPSVKFFWNYERK